MRQADSMLPPKARLLSGTLGLTLLAAAIAAAQSAPEPMSAAKADKAADAPAASAKTVPAPVKYTELKKTLWPPKAGVKTPGVQIPITNLKPEAEIPLAPILRLGAWIGGDRDGNAAKNRDYEMGAADFVGEVEFDGPWPAGYQPPKILKATISTAAASQ
jgi:hypothetical protein